MQRTRGNNFYVRAVEACDPATAVLLAILKRAKADAARGDLAAVAWLVSDGLILAEAIHDGASNDIVAFCRQVLARVEQGEMAAKWTTHEY